MNSIDRDRLNYYELAREGFDRAEKAGKDPVERNFIIGSKNVSLKFASSALVSKLTPAIAHLESNFSGPPDLTIRIWDSESTDTPLPLLLGSLVDLLRLRWFERLGIRKEIKDYHGDRIRSIFHLGPDILSLFDTERGEALYWVESEAKIPYYEEGYPLTPILNWWLETQGKQLLHAAAVGTSEGGVIVCGKGGSGKSTTALSCINSNLKFLGDDYCALDTREAPAVWSLYSTSKLKGPEDVERFSKLKHVIKNPDKLEEEKALLFLNDYFPEGLVGHFPLKAVFVPRITGRPETKISEISPVVALRALAPSTMFQLPGDGVASFKHMSRLVKTVPCHYLDLGTDITRIPDVIADFLAV